MRLLVFVLLLMAGPSPVIADATSKPMLQLLFEEREPGLEPFTTRYLIDKRYLRIDGGDDDGDYVLFDRVKGEIYNFNHEDRTEIIVQRRSAVPLSSTLGLDQEDRLMPGAPAINGIIPRSVLFFADNQLCRSSVNFPGMLPQATRAMIQFESLIQQQNRISLEQVPQEMQLPCFLANNYLAATAYLEAGFPVQMTDYEGREKRLLDFGYVDKPLGLLRRMRDYRVFYPNAGGLDSGR